MTRVLSIWLPNLAVERWAKGTDSPPDAPVVLTVEGTHGPVIHAVTQAAAERGALKHRKRIIERQLVVERLANMAIELYATAATIARTQRLLAERGATVDRVADGGPEQALARINQDYRYGH